jgi:glycosyltransferase involved in cell wall biosynthesis
MSTLVLTGRHPNEPSNGYDLRVLGLCRHMAGPRHLYVVNLDPTSQPDSDSIAAEVFDSLCYSSTPPYAQAALRRHLRLSQSSYLKRAFPGWFAAELLRIRTEYLRIGASRLVVFGTALAGFARDLQVPRVLYDVCDSHVLTLRRQNQLNGFDESALVARIAAQLALKRFQRSESQLLSWFSQVTTINDADTREVLRSYGRPAENIHTIPNGVAEELLVPVSRFPLRRAVAFWGNLSFPPNQEAMRFFVRSVYLPYLKPSGVAVRIIGRGAEPWLVELAKHDSNLELMGFVDNLAEAVRGFPVMVNPMLSGSGMKNKVLEAFALGLAVVTTKLGIEAFPDAIVETHYSGADDPTHFASAILKMLENPNYLDSIRSRARNLVESTYRWSVIGKRFDTLLPPTTSHLDQSTSIARRPL